MPSRVSSAMTRAAAVRSPSAGISTDEFKDNEFDGNTRYLRMFMLWYLIKCNMFRNYQKIR